MLFDPPTATAQEKKVTVVCGKPRFYEPPALKAARQLLRFKLAPHRPGKLMQGALRLTVIWRFPMIKGVKSGQYKLTRPDTDNLQKSLKDIMTELNFWVDDAQVASETVEKVWSDTPGIYIRIEEAMPLPKGTEVSDSNTETKKPKGAGGKAYDLHHHRTGNTQHMGINNTKAQDPHGSGAEQGHAPPSQSG